MVSKLTALIAGEEKITENREIESCDFETQD